MDEQYKTISKAECPHAGTELKVLSSDKKACQACGEAEHLRPCTSCGSVFCCESSEGHNTEHWKQAGQPIIISFLTTTTSLGATPAGLTSSSGSRLAWLTKGPVARRNFFAINASGFIQNGANFYGAKNEGSHW